jgi:hypothetical protein
MSSDIDLEAHQVTQAAPPAGTFFPLLITVKVVMVREEEVEGAETHETDVHKPRTSSVAGSPRPVSTGQDINNEAQPVVPQAEGVTSICSAVASRFPRRLSFSVTGPSGGDISEININQSRSHGDVSRTTSDSQAEAHFRACFLTIVEI